MISIKLRALAPAAMLATIALQFSCKTTNSTTMTLTGNSAATLSCGPDRTFYFHWAPESAAKGWLADSGAPPLSDLSSLLPASSPRYALSTKTIDRLIRNDKFGPSWMAGPGVYLAIEPSQTEYFGDTLLIFRFRDSQGKGLLCKDWTKDDDPGRTQNINSPGSPGAPVLAEYDSVSRWFIAPRAPIVSQGESVLFVPCTARHIASRPSLV